MQETLHKQVQAKQEAVLEAGFNDCAWLGARKHLEVHYESHRKVWRALKVKDTNLEGETSVPTEILKQNLQHLIQKPLERSQSNR